MREKMREDASAVPQPLFSSSAPIPQQPFQPVTATHSDELDDTIGELQVPPLREKRSGYFVRQRSRTDLRLAAGRSHTSLYTERDRWNIFPQWAWSFYGGKAGLASNNASKVTLAGPAYNSQNGSRISVAQPSTRGHSRHATVDSFVSRPGSSHSNWETVYSPSPSSRFVPSIFGLRMRPRAFTETTMTASQRDSMSISELRSEIPDEPLSQLPPSPQIAAKRTSARQSQRYSVQRSIRAHPNRQTIRAISHSQPVPLSVDSSYISFPHLVQNRRLTRVLSAWRVPSIDEPFREDMLGPNNRQILAFCVGFLFPPLWIVAAFLPLPYRPVVQSHDDENGHFSAIFGRGKERVDLDIQSEWNWEEERSFHKARWWRTLNRVMSVIGLAIIAVVVSLLRSRKRDQVY